MFVTTNTSFFLTKVCLPRQNKIFVATNTCFQTCDKHSFFCHDKHTFVTTKDMFCHNNTHVVTILVAATASKSEKVKVPADLYALKMSEVKNKDRKQYTHIQVEVQEEGERRRRVMGQVVQDSLQVHL